MIIKKDICSNIGIKYLDFGYGVKGSGSLIDEILIDRWCGWCGD